jgi:hypothetical protein
VISRLPTKALILRSLHLPTPLSLLAVLLPAPASSQSGTAPPAVDGTYRTDSSQLERNAFQIEVNRRHPVFYAEKRPFFMEGMGTFELAGSGGDGNTRTAVHARKITDPLHGLKLTGAAGNLNFATLSASDEGPGTGDAEAAQFGENHQFSATVGPGIRAATYILAGAFIPIREDTPGSRGSCRSCSHWAGRTAPKAARRMCPGYVKTLLSPSALETNRCAYAYQ